MMVKCETFKTSGKWNIDIEVEIPDNTESFDYKMAIRKARPENMREEYFLFNDSYDVPNLVLPECLYELRGIPI